MQGPLGRATSTSLISTGSLSPIHPLSILGYHHGTPTFTGADPSSMKTHVQSLQKLRSVCNVAVASTITIAATELTIRWNKIQSVQFADLCGGPDNTSFDRHRYHSTHLLTFAFQKGGPSRLHQHRHGAWRNPRSRPEWPSLVDREGPVPVTSTLARNDNADVARNCSSCR